MSYNPSLYTDEVHVDKECNRDEMRDWWREKWKLPKGLFREEITHAAGEKLRFDVAALEFEAWLKRKDEDRMSQQENQLELEAQTVQESKNRAKKSRKEVKRWMSEKDRLLKQQRQAEAKEKRLKKKMEKEKMHRTKLALEEYKVALTQRSRAETSVKETSPIQHNCNHAFERWLARKKTQAVEEEKVKAIEKESIEIQKRLEKSKKWQRKSPSNLLSYSSILIS